MAAEDSLEQRRTGAETRGEIQRVAFELFTAQGYESTSLRQIAEMLGINKASIYYHFENKEAILGSLFKNRGSEAEELANWVERQDPGPEVVEQAILRWVDSFSEQKLRGIRFLRANPHIAHRLKATGESSIGDPLNRLSALLADRLTDATATEVLILRMAILSINAAVEAAATTDASDETIVATARTAARALTAQLKSA